MSATLETETTTTFDYFYYNDNEIINQGIEETATNSFDYRTSATNSHGYNSKTFFGS